MDSYILNSAGVPVRESDYLKAAQWKQENWQLCQVGRTAVGQSDVSTVFLGLDHGFGGLPVLWETLVFGGKLDMEMDRCIGTKEQAEAMHLKMVAAVMAAEGVSEIG